MKYNRFRGEKPQEAGLRTFKPKLEIQQNAPETRVSTQAGESWENRIDLGITKDRMNGQAFSDASFELIRTDLLDVSILTTEGRHPNLEL